MPTFPRICTRGQWRNNVRSTRVPVRELNEVISELDADACNTEVDENPPLKEIAIDLSQQPDETLVDESSYAPRCLEFWKVDHVLSTCNCGNTFCFTDGLCDIIPPTFNADRAAKEPRVDTKRNTQSPSFLKVEKVDPNKSGFIVPPENRGNVCSISRAVSDLEEFDEDEQRRHNSPKTTKKQLEENEHDHKENRRKRVLNRVQSYHLAVPPLGKSDSFSGTDKEEDIEHLPEENEDVTKSDEMPKTRFVHDRIRLPMRAGRSKSHDVDGILITPDGQVKLRSSYPSNNSGTRSKTPTNTKSRISRLPMRAGRVNKTQESKTSVPTIEDEEKNDAPFDEQEVSRNVFIERRRKLIATTRNQSEPYYPLDEELDFEPLIEVSHDSCFEVIEATHRDRKTNNQAENKIKMKIDRQSGSKAHHSSLDYSVESGMTIEETFEEESEESEYVLDEILRKHKVKRNTKAGWITKQMGREARMDRIDDVQNIELVYTPSDI